MDPVSLATAAVAVLSPYLVEGGKEVTETAAKDLFTWLKSKLTGRAAEALSDLEKAPAAEDNLADLRKQLVKVLEADRSSVRSCAGCCPRRRPRVRRRRRSISPTAPWAKAAQVHGNQNVTKVGRVQPEAGRLA